MKAIAYWAIASGALLVALVLAAPYIAQWQMHDTLSRYGAEHMARDEARQVIQDRMWGFAISFALGCASVAAGVLVLRRKKLGWTIWVWVCVIFIVLSAFDFILSGDWLISTLRVAWWLAALLITIRIFRRNEYGHSWWSEAAART